MDLDGKEEWKVNQTQSQTTTTSDENSTTTVTSIKNQSATVYGPYKDEKAVSDAVASGSAQLHDVKTSVTTVTTISPNPSDNKSTATEGHSKALDDAAVISGTISTGYDAWKSSLTKTSTTVNGISTGLSIISSVLGDAQVAQQYSEGGISNVNPFDAANATVGTAGTIINILSWWEIGGATLAAAGEALTPISIGISSTQAWFGLYKSMEDLNYAPSYIDGNGQPVYIETDPSNECPY